MLLFFSIEHHRIYHSTKTKHLLNKFNKSNHSGRTINETYRTWRNRIRWQFNSIRETSIVWKLCNTLYGIRTSHLGRFKILDPWQLFNVFFLLFSLYQRIYICCKTDSIMYVFISHSQVCDLTFFLYLLANAKVANKKLSIHPHVVVLLSRVDGIVNNLTSCVLLIARFILDVKQTSKHVNGEIYCYLVHLCINKTIWETEIGIHNNIYTSVVEDCVF